MSDYHLNKVLFAFAGKHRMVESIADEELAGYELTDAERGALREGDLTRLYELGANPYLIRRVFRPRFKV